VGLKSSKKVLYENCKIFSMDGELLSRCGKSRAMFYLNKNIATKLKDEPLEIQLTFVHNNGVVIDKEYYLQDRKNECSVCGSITDLTLHHVVPLCYRRHFPDEIKNFSSHDVLPLCIECHEKYEIFAHQLKREISIQYEIPMNNGVDEKTKLKVNRLSKIKSWAMPLVRTDNNIPVERKVFLLARIKTEMGTEEVNLEEICSWDIPKLLQVKSYGKATVEKVKDLEEFQSRWRRHFVEKMQPKFLPEHW
jgi:hypothetical protein